MSQREHSRRAPEPSIGLAEALADVIDILEGRAAWGGDGPDDWARMVAIIAENDSLPNSEVKRIEQAIDEAYHGWSDAQHRPIWYETDSGMTDDDSLCDPSFIGIWPSRVTPSPREVGQQRRLPLFRRGDLGLCPWSSTWRFSTRS